MGIKFNNEEEFKELIFRYKEELYDFVYSKTNDEELSKDLVQDSLIKAYKVFKQNRYVEQGKLKSWLFMIARNVFIDYYRRDKKYTVLRDMDAYQVFKTIKDESSDSEESIIDIENSEKIQKILDTLPETQRDIIKYRFFDNLRFKEISEIEGISINTALGRARNALLSLKKIIKSKGNIV